MMRNLGQIIQRWTDQSLPLLPPHEAHEVIAALTSTGKPFAKDIVALYQATGGIDGTMDNLCFSLWPLRRVRFENMHSPHSDLAFADFLIESFHFTLHFESETCSSVFGDYDHTKVADSLDEFWHLYLTNPDRLGLWGG